MFYFLFPAILTYNVILIAAAVIPAVFLMLKAYRSDRIERESPQLLWNLVVAGILSSLIALLAERVLSTLLGLVAQQGSTLYNVLLYFGVVAFSEEGAKYFMLKRRTWRSSEFNCLYDGIVYALFVSLGFALWENLSYVMTNGFATALVRAVTAIPGHACFGVFMGFFYGIARSFENSGKLKEAKLSRALTVVVPALLHGAYDYIATSSESAWFFVAFVAVLFIVSYRVVGKAAKADRYI
ncbi:MAG: PrsW family intramembrane metalloprotease [Lachnospiraceae bacterium]|nr:PrsW family intramembrane metalloprotease [Lachnospiraceae bacterium]